VLCTTLADVVAYVSDLLRLFKDRRLFLSGKYRLVMVIIASFGDGDMLGHRGFDARPSNRC
jgi:hypothetical protein